MSTNKIVVGMDGSPHARAALRWAVDHAEDDTEVVVVNAWNVPAVSGFEVSMLDPQIFEDGARASLEEAVADVLGPDGRNRVRAALPCGHSGAALLDEAADADLLVVGARGHGGFAGLLLGSVSTYVVHHATCPTVVVPLTDDTVD